MAIFIEKLSLEEITPDLVHLTITDFVKGDHGIGTYTYQDFPHDTSLIRDLILPQLEKSNIFLGKHYGLSGISISNLLNNDYSMHDYYVEIPVRHIYCYNLQDLILLSNKYKIIFVDIEEGDSYHFVWYDHNNVKQKTKIKKFLKESGINVDNVYYASPSFEQIKICREIKLYKIWILMQALCTPIVQDIIQNNNKQKYLDILEKKPYKQFAVFRNWRARHWRVVLLSLLHNNKVLDNIDWSLIGEYGHLTYDRKNIEFSKDDFLKYVPQDWLNHSDLTGIIDKFFTAHNNILPKFLLDTDTVDKFSLMNIDTDQFKKYCYSIDIDNAPLLTEKPAKSFLQGSTPILIFTFPNGIDKMRSFNFKFPDYDFNNFPCNDNVINQVANTIKFLHDSKITPNIDDVVHNFELCADKHKLASYVVQPLVDVFG